MTFVGCAVGGGWGRVSESTWRGILVRLKVTKGGRFSANAKMPSLLSSGTYFLLPGKNNDNIDNVGDGEDNQIHEIEK